MKTLLIPLTLIALLVVLAFFRKKILGMSKVSKFIDYIFTRGIKPLPETPPPTLEEVNKCLELYGVVGNSDPILVDLVKKKSKSNLCNYTKVVFAEETVFDISKCVSKEAYGCKFYLICDVCGLGDELYYISDREDDCAVYLYSENPDIREFYDDIPVIGTNTFAPWKDSETLGEYIIDQIKGIPQS